jgi:hypothetical protein
MPTGVEDAYHLRQHLQVTVFFTVVDDRSFAGEKSEF